MTVPKWAGRKFHVSNYRVQLLWGRILFTVGLACGLTLGVGFAPMLSNEAQADSTAMQMCAQSGPQYTSVVLVETVGLLETDQTKTSEYDPQISGIKNVDEGPMQMCGDGSIEMMNQIREMPAVCELEPTQKKVNAQQERCKTWTQSKAQLRSE